MEIKIYYQVIDTQTKSIECNFMDSLEECVYWIKSYNQNINKTFEIKTFIVTS